MTYTGLLNKDNIPENGIFVFGSNKIGINGNPSKGTGGAALVAQLEFGVKHGEIMDNCLSESKKAYGLTTVHAPKKYLTNDEIISNIKKLYEHANLNLDKSYYVAYDGTHSTSISLNGKTKLVLSRLFYLAGKIPDNIVFEHNFKQLIDTQKRIYELNTGERLLP